MAFGRISGAVFAVALSVAVTSGHAESVGTVTFIKNYAEGTNPQGDTSRKLRADQIVRDEFLQTFERGALIFTLADQTDVTMGSDATLVVDKFVYSPDRGGGEEVFRLVKGALCFASGKLPGRNVKIITPVAVIGVCGT